MSDHPSLKPNWLFSQVRTHLTRTASCSVLHVWKSNSGNLKVKSKVQIYSLVKMARKIREDLHLVLPRLSLSSLLLSRPIGFYLTLLVLNSEYVMMNSGRRYKVPSCININLFLCRLNSLTSSFLMTESQEILTWLKTLMLHLCVCWKWCAWLML